MSTQPTEIPAPTPRTITDVETDMHATNARIVNHRSRRGPITNHHERVNGHPTDLVTKINELHDEWAWYNAGGPALDFPTDTTVDEQPHATMTGGPLDADCG